MTTSAAAPRSATAGAPSAGRGQRGSGIGMRLRAFTLDRGADLEYTLLTATVLALVGFGLVMVLSSSTVEEYAAGNLVSAKFVKQLVFAGVGVPVMIVASRVPVRFLLRLAWPLLAVAIVLQALVLVPGVGIMINGNRAWIAVGGFTLQPAEVAKTALVIWIGMMIGRKGDRIRSWHHLFVPIGIPIAIVIGLALFTKDLGTLMVVGVLVMGTLYFGGARIAHLSLIGLAAAGGVAAMTLQSDNRMRRIGEFLSDACDYDGGCWKT